LSEKDDEGKEPGPAPEESLTPIIDEDKTPSDARENVIRLEENIATAKAIQEIGMQSILFLFVLVVAAFFFWSAICLAKDLVRQHHELSAFFDAKVIFVLSVLLVPPTLFIFTLLRAVFPKPQASKILREDAESNMSSKGRDDSEETNFGLLIKALASIIERFPKIGGN
jgi:hypothetical protein